MIPNQISEEKLKNGFEFYLTVGKLKQFIEDNNLPDDAKVMIQRVEDKYYDNHNWGSYLKKGEHYHYALQHNKDIENGKYLNKEEYPNINEDNLIPYTEEELKGSMEQYHPAFCCVYYKDDEDLLFIDLHY